MIGAVYAKSFGVSASQEIADSEFDTAPSWLDKTLVSGCAPMPEIWDDQVQRKSRLCSIRIQNGFLSVLKLPSSNGRWPE